MILLHYFMFGLFALLALAFGIRGERTAYTGSDTSTYACLVIANVWAATA